MSERKLISKNSFLGGMVQDKLSSLSDFTSYWYARNAIHSTSESKNFGLTNEGSTRVFADIGTDVVGWAYCEERNWTIVFKQDDSLHFVNHADGSFTPIMTAGEFGCTWGFSDCEWVGGSVQFKTMGPCNELHVYFTSGCEAYKVNIDLMLDPERKAGLIKELACDTKCGYEANCEYFKTTKRGCAPAITPIAYTEGGGNVPAGSYLFLVRLKHTDGGETNWFHHSDAVHVGSEHNIAGEPTRAHIDVNITGIDCKFAKMELAVIENIGGIKTAKLLNVVNFGNTTYTYRYTGTDGFPIDLTELLIKENTYIQPKYQLQKDGRMLYYGIKPRRNPNWQPKVNAIEVEWVLREFSYSDVKKYNLKGFMGGESYSFAIVPNFTDGTHGESFPILVNPVSGATSGDQTSSVSEHFKEQPNDNASASAQPQGDLLTAVLTTDEEIVRTRVPKPDQVSDPQNDDLDIIIDDLVDNMDTDMSDDLCREIALREEFLNAACCNCDGEEDVTPTPVTPSFTPTYTPVSDTPSFTPTYTPTYTPNLALALGLDDNVEILANNNDGTGCGEGAASEKCGDEATDIEGGIGEWGDIVAGGIEDDLDPTTSSTKIYEGAQAITEAIKRRERVERIKREYNIEKDVSYTTFDPEGADPPVKGAVTFAGPLFDGRGNNITEVEFTEIASGKTIADLEENITYPCMTDCNGEFIFGTKANQPVENHLFPDSSEQAHFISKAIGVPYGKYFGDSGEESDLYVRLLGIRFKNIEQLTDDEISIPLCTQNPYTIVMVERTDSNKQILMKGLATGTYIITNNGKTYEIPRYGANSMDKVSYYHDDGDGGRLSTGDSGSSHTLFSLDGLTIKPSIAAATVKEELRLGGAGERYGLYAKGEAPEDALKGSRIDALGARQSVNLNSWSQTGTEHDLTFRKYARANDAVSPGSGGTKPLMNRSQQACVWIGSGMAQLEDESFTGDVLQHNAPIADVKGQYVSLRRDLPDQYGNLENMNYIPLLQAGPNHGNEIEGIVGDVYTGLFSFVKTGFVSDKVGSCIEAEKYNIPAMVATKKEKRCICDGPEDVVHQANGAWMWTELPEDGDAADPKNWAGTHTTIASKSETYNEAVGTPAKSDFYYPGTTTTNISYVGQFETCPWLREKSDRLEEQWYPEIKSPDFRFDSGVSVDGNVNGWKDSFLNQFHREIEQPSLIKKIWKTVIRTTLNVLFPMMGIDNLFDVVNGGAQFVGNLAEFPMLLALWYLMTQVLFTNKNIDKLLGIPVCKDDNAGGFLEGYNRGLFYNFTRYNLDYSWLSNLYSYEGMPDPYYTCDCDECLDGEETNEIYVSDRQLNESSFDAYTNVRPLSKIKISASFGKLTNLFVAGGQLYAQTTDALIPLPVNKTLVNSDKGALIFGQSGFIVEPTGAMTEGIPEGYAGLSRHNESLSCQYGQFWIDGEADVIYKFSGGQLDVLSAKGMFNFFKEKLNFCTITGCIDQKKTGTAYYSLGVDPRHNRLLVTKSDGVNSFTISYDLETERWISFHDYMPRAYLSDRRDMFSLANGAMHRHNEDNSFQTFYGTSYPHEIEFTATAQDSETFVLEGIVLNTEASEGIAGGRIEDLDITFEKMAFWNSTQGTGTVSLVVQSDDKGQVEDMRAGSTDLADSIRIEKTDRFWHMNEIKDFRKKDCMKLPMVISTSCGVRTEINDDIFDCAVLNQQNNEGKVVADKYAKFRFTFDGPSNINLNTIYISTYGKHKPING